MRINLRLFAFFVAESSKIGSLDSHMYLFHDHCIVSRKLKVRREFDATNCFNLPVRQAAAAAKGK